MRRAVGPQGIAAALGACAVLALSATAPASAAERVDRVVQDSWRNVSNAGVIDVVKTDEGGFTSIVVTGDDECYPVGTVLHEFSGSEPRYTGIENVAITQGGECTGEFERREATMLVSWDSQKLRFSALAGSSRSSWEKQRIDSDRDGLFDDEEISGVNTYADELRGVDPKIEVDLPAMGADPMRRDVFVEIDHMPGYSIDPEAVELIARTYAEANVGNPDGSEGISLHIDAGPNTVMDIRSGQTWGELSRADSVPLVNRLGSVDAADEYDWSKFLEYKGEHLLDERGLVFHYAIAARHHALSGVGGESMGIPGGNFMVALQCPGVRTACSVDSLDQAALIMHELGHNVGLRHGGGDDINHKPNHFSVMNYSYTGGVPLVGTDNFYFGYSFVGPAEIPDMNERSLDERAGVRSSLMSALAIYACARSGRWRRVRLNRPADFDCDGSASGTVSTDVNDDTERVVLRTANEWDLVTLDRNFFSGGPAVPVSDAGAASSSAGASQLPPGFSVAPPDASFPSVETPGFFDTRGLLRGDQRKPRLRLRRTRRGRTVLVRAGARDDKQLDRLIVDVGGRNARHIEREPKRRRGTVSIRVSVQRGARVGVVALDTAGNARERRFRAR